jgi:hypothetical protein
MNAYAGKNDRIFISDGCNSFVFYGGISAIILLCLLLAFSFIPFVTKKWLERNRRDGTNELKVLRK